MSRVIGSTLALVIAGPALLVLEPTAPPHRPVGALAAAPLGAAAGVLLFAALARRRPQPLLSPLALVTATVVGVAGMSEEALWRGFALARLAPVAGLAAAIAITTAGFALAHVPALRVRGASVQLGTGVVFGCLFAATGSLLACALAHAAYNVLAILGRARTASAISLREVEKRFGAATAIHQVDLDVARGELVALLGPNGAGKTTLVSLVVGLRRPTRGCVRVLGGDPRGWRARRGIGTTPQEMGFPPTLRAGEILDLARAHAAAPPPLTDLAERFGVESFLRRQAGALSGGQRRRLALALAFAGTPELVVLDEPTTGLDVEARRQAWAAIRAFSASGGTVLFSTHHLDEAHALAGRTVVIARGAVVADGHVASENELLCLTR